MTTACVMILPFISIYTKGVTDINYFDKLIAALMVLIGTVEMLHIPSGHMINMSGNFKVSKTFQIIACLLLISSMAILGSIFGIYGMLVSLLIVAVLLAVLEIGFIHTRFFVGKVGEFIRMLIPYIVVGTLISFVEMSVINVKNSIVGFLMFGMIYMAANTLIGIVLGYVFNRNEQEKLMVRGKSLLRHFSRKTV